LFCSIIISVGQKAVKELDLVSGTSRHFVVQFLLDDRNFKEMRTVLEAITDTQLDILFPNFSQQLDFSNIVKNQSGYVNVKYYLQFIRHFKIIL